MRRRHFVAMLGRIGMLAFLPPRRPGRTRRPGHWSAPRIDVHAHVFGPALVDRMRSLIETPEIRDAITTVEADPIIGELDRTGVERALLLSTAFVASGCAVWGRRSPSEEYRDVREENDFTAAQAATAGGRLIPFASVNPRSDYAVEELTRCIDRLGMRGLAVNFGGNDVRLGESRHLQQVRELCACAADRNIPVVAEIHNPEVEATEAVEMDRLVSQVIAPLPALHILIAHLGSSGGVDFRAHHSFAALIAAIERRPAVRRRVWVDCGAVFLAMAFSPPTAASEARLAQLSTLLDGWPIDRLLWGSDNIPDALDEARRIWPQGQAAWEAMAASDGSALLA